jgi:flagellar hook-associated protein 2
MSTISSLLPFMSSSLTGSQGIDTQSLIAQATAAQQAANTPSPQSTELQANQNHITGLNQLLSALTAFDASLQGVQQQEASGSATDVAKAAQQFVDAYNTLVTTISNLTGTAGTGTAGALAGDGVAGDVANALTQSEGNVLSNTLGGLDSIGITKNSDGTLSLDTNALQQAFTANPGETTSLLNQAAQSLDQVATQYSDPNGAIASERETLTLQQPVLQANSSASNKASSQQQQAVAEYLALTEAQITSQMLSNLAQQTFDLTGSSAQSNLLPQLPTAGTQDPTALTSLFGLQPAAPATGSTDAGASNTATSNTTAPAGSISLLA